MSHPTLLAELAAQRHWSIYDGAEQFRRTAEELGLVVEVSPKQWSVWLNAGLKRLPRAVSCRVLERMFNRPAQMLLAPPAGPAPMTGTGIPADVSPELLAAAAEESAAHLADVEPALVGPATLEKAHDDIAALARRYANTPPWTIWNEAIGIRRRIRELLDRTRRPDQQRDLYLALGELCGLLAGASFDLGDEDSAVVHARAAWGWGEHIGHDGLRAWSRGMQALISYWGGRSEEAVRLARSGQQYLTGGTGLVRAACIEARAWSYLGNRQAAQQALDKAMRARDGSGRDELHDGIGGEFGFGRARQARCEGTVFVQLGVSAGAEPANLAAAYLLQGAVGDAAAELDSVLSVPAEHRIRGLIERLDLVATLLPGQQPARQAADLGQAITDFMAIPASRAITAGGTSRPALPAPRQ